MKRTGIYMKLEIPWSQKCDDQEIDFEISVTGYYHPGRPAKISGPPEECYPEDPDEFEVESVGFSDGEAHPELDDDLDLYDAICEIAREEYEAMLDDRRSEQAAERAYWRDYDTGRS